MKKKIDLKQFVKRKNKMMLIQMNINWKGKITKQLAKQITDKREKLKECKTSIKDDFTSFRNFLKQSKIQSKTVVKQAEEAMGVKLQLETKLKSIRERKNWKINSNGKLLEQIKELFQYKQFYENAFIKKDKILMNLTMTINTDLLYKVGSPFQKIYKDKVSWEIYNYLTEEEENVEFNEKDIFMFNNVCNKIENINLGKMINTEELAVKYETDYQSFDTLITKFKKEKKIMIDRRDSLKDRIREIKRKKRLLGLDKERRCYKITKALKIISNKLYMLWPKRDTNILKFVKNLEADILKNSKVICKANMTVIKEYEKKVMDEYKSRLMYKMESNRLRFADGKDTEIGMELIELNKRCRKDLFRSFFKNKKDKPKQNKEAEEDDYENKYFIE